MSLATEAFDALLGELRFLRSDRAQWWYSELFKADNSPNSDVGAVLEASCQTLEEAEIYAVTADIYRTLRYAVSSLPATTLRAEMLPSKAGFIYLDHGARTAR